MKFQVTDGEKFQKIMTAEVPVEELELPIKFACKRLAEKVNIPGFRKGKAPRSVLESYLGMPAILEEAADDLMGKAYSQGLTETGLEPVARPEAELVQMEADQPMVFKFTITVKPELKLGQYKGLEITRKIIEIEETDIDQELEQQRNRMRRLVAADKAAEKGDVVSIDFKGFKGTEAFPGGEAEKYPLELGSNAFIPGFEDQLIGCKAGDELDLNVTFPEDYQEKSLAGQPVVFKVKVHEVRQYELPELDDNFIQQVSETAENMEQLRDEIKVRLTEESARMANDQTRSDAIMAAVENVEVELPPVMVEQQTDELIDQMANQLSQQGLSIEKFLEYTKGSMDTLRANYRDQAEMIVKRDLMLEEIAKAEDIQVSEEEIEEQLNILAQTYYQPIEKIKEIMSQNNRMQDIKDSIKMQKAAELLFTEAKITDEIVDREALIKEAEARAAAQAAEAAETVENDAPEEGEIVEAEVKDAE